MSKHHRSAQHWREIMRQGRRPAGAPAGSAGEGGRGEPGRRAATGGASAARPQQPLRRAPPAAAGSGAAARAPRLDGTGQPYITLAQLLKKLNLVGSGGGAKATVRAGGISVNGEGETRPGRKLHQGDRVTIDGHDHQVDLSGG